MAFQLTRATDRLDDSNQRDDVLFFRRRPNRRRINHWATRNSDDFVRYPRLPPLTYLQETNLIRKAQAGDTAARNEVWLHYARLSLSVVNLFRIPDGLLADAVQEGCIGLNRAIEKYDITRFNAFSTYAWHWIYQSVQRFLIDHLFALRIPSYLFSEYMRFRRRLNRCHTRLAESAVVDQWNRGNPKLLKRLTMIHDAIDPLPLHEIKRSQHPLHHVDQSDELVDREGLCRQALRHLRDRDREILEMRFGFFGREPMTLREIGEALHVTRERIRQLQENAERKLRKRCPHLLLLIGSFAAELQVD